MDAEQSNQIFEGVEINNELQSEKEPSLKRKGKLPSTASTKTSKKEIRMPRCSSPLPFPPPSTPSTTTHHECKKHSKKSSSTPGTYKSESYEKFKSRLENPLRKICHRGKQPLDTSIISSHLVVNREPVNPKYPELNYTYIMTFPESFDLEEFEAQENIACTSQNWERCFLVEQAVYYLPYFYHIPHYYTQPFYYHYHYNPYYYHLC